MTIKKPITKTNTKTKMTIKIKLIFKPETTVNSTNNLKSPIIITNQIRRI
jgi:hypothetical protein